MIKIVLMMKKTLFLAFLTFFSLFILSCSSVKTITSDPARLDDEALMRRINENNLDFEYLKYNCDVNLKNDAMNVDGNAEIRMKKDEYVWVVLKKFGLEIARAMIRPDSFFIIDRINRTISTGSTATFANSYGIPFQFNDIQHFIAGNNILYQHKIINRKSSEINYQILTSGNNYSSSLTIDRNFLIIFARIFDNSDKSIEANFSDFRKTGLITVPYTRIYSFSDRSASNQVIEIKLNDFVINKEHKIKFEIPSGYEKI